MWLKKVLPYVVIAVLLSILFHRQPAKPYVIERGAEELQPVVLKDTIEIKGKTLIVEKENPINEKLLNDFKQLQDSIKRIDMYKDAIEIRTYRETYKDIQVESKVQGYLTHQKVTYKPKRYNLYTGVETTITTKPVFTGKVYLRRDKTIYSVGYNTDKQITLGVAFKLF